MICPKCMQDNVSIVGNTHYICNTPNCVDQNGNRTQFLYVEDDKVHFPFNQIFVNRTKKDFYRKPYLKINSSK